MTNWLERARRESPTPLDKSVAIADERNLTAATAASRLEGSGFSRASNGSNGSTPPEGCREIEGPDQAVLWWRIAITEPGGRTFEVDSPSGFTLPEWQAYAERYHAPGCTITPIAGLPKPRAPVLLGKVLAAACEGVAGISLAQFRALLSPDDVADIEAGDIPAVPTLRAYALGFAERIRSGRIAP
ncbi:MAG: hypothetical protein ACREXU_21155 [Gammaproteobacteria bacterium]